MQEEEDAALSSIEDEHFVPNPGLGLENYLAAGDVAGVHHLLRYIWAERMLGQRNLRSVLDVACGDGYGTHMLALAMPSVQFLGVDYDADAVSAAREKYRAPNLGYRVGDVCQWDSSIGSSVFDAIVSFDTLEHVQHREIMLESLVNHLADGGCWLMSTPLSEQVLVRPDWDCHRIEYSFSALFDLLHRYFAVVRRPDDGSLPGLEVFDVLEGSNVEYLLKMNPVQCEHPIRIVNPYRKESARPKG